MRYLLIAITLLASAGINAATITIDFDDLPLGGTPLLGDFVEVITEGYRFTSEVGVSDFLDPGGNKVMLGVSYGIDFDTGEIGFGRQDGAAFALYAADFSGVSFYIASSDNGSFGSSTGPGLDELGTGAWLNINSLFLSGETVPFAPITIDNIIVGSAVPVPAAVWLFGSGLAGLGFLRRKKS